LAGVNGVELLPAGHESMASFCGSLDAFFYRTGASREAYGRVVLEAMAAGLPVVVHELGGYAEVIEQGVSGYIIQNQEEAYDSMMALKASAALCLKVGAAAMTRATAVHGRQANLNDIVRYLA